MLSCSTRSHLEAGISKIQETHLQCNIVPKSCYTHRALTGPERVSLTQHVLGNTKMLPALTTPSLPSVPGATQQFSPGDTLHVLLYLGVLIGPGLDRGSCGGCRGAPGHTQGAAWGLSALYPGSGSPKVGAEGDCGSWPCWGASLQGWGVLGGRSWSRTGVLGQSCKWGCLGAGTSTPGRHQGTAAGGSPSRAGLGYRELGPRAGGYGPGGDA